MTGPAIVAHGETVEPHEHRDVHGPFPIYGPGNIDAFHELGVDHSVEGYVQAALDWFNDKGIGNGRQLTLRYREVDGPQDADIDTMALVWPERPDEIVVLMGGSDWLTASPARMRSTSARRRRIGKHRCGRSMRCTPSTARWWPKMPSTT